jgi:nucleotide-binding universal stress UspA family protein
MQTILALVDEDATAHHALEAAARRADRRSAGLVVLNVLPEEEYDSRHRAVSGLPGGTERYTHSQARSAAAVAAGRIARTVLEGRAIPYTAVGAVGDPVEAVLSVARDHDCGAIVVPAARPRLFGLLGRFDRALAWRFDGTVTRVTPPAAGGVVAPAESVVDQG